MALDFKNIASSNVSDAVSSISGAVSDPFGAVIQKTINKISSLTSNIERKVDQLVQEVAKKTDSKGRVSLQGTTLIITVRREDMAQAEQIKKQIMDRIESIKKTITILQNVINSLAVVQTAMTVYKSFLDLQEVALSSNPVSLATLQVLKKGIKIIFLREIINQYVKILGKQLAQNKQVLTNLLSKFRNIQVTVKIQDEAEKGNYVTPDVAENLLADDLLGNNIVSDTQDFTDNNFNQYILKVEKYGEKQIIAKAYEKQTGMIKAQTAPSYFSTPEDLMEELKTILNL